MKEQGKIKTDERKDHRYPPNPPPPASPLTLSTMRVACPPCSPTRWPLRLLPPPPVVLTSSRHLQLREKLRPLGCTARRRAAPRFCWDLVPGCARKLSGLLQDGFQEGFLLASPLRAVLEQVLSGLDSVLAPPEIRVRATGRPLEVLSGEAVASLLVKREARHLLAPATTGSDFRFSLGRYLRLPVLAIFLLIQFTGGDYSINLIMSASLRSTRQRGTCFTYTTNDNHSRARPSGRDGRQETEKIVCRHSLDRLNASMIKQKKFLFRHTIRSLSLTMGKKETTNRRVKGRWVLYQHLRLL